VIANIPGGVKVPSVATTLSKPAANVGDLVHDSAKLFNVTSDAGGTVKYTVYTNSACSLGAKDAGTKSVTGGVVQDSNPITFTTAGAYYWQAVYSGDTNNLGATSGCGSEFLPVGEVILTTLSSSSGVVGDSVHDSATLYNVTNAGGTVTYTYYTNSACTGTGTAVGSPVTVTAGVVPDSNPVTFGSAGTYYWQAVYTGDIALGGTNLPAKSACGSEILFVDAVCTVPDLVTNAKNGQPESAGQVPADWSAAGFKTTVLFSPLNPANGKKVTGQSIPAGTPNEPCSSTAITVTW